MTTAQDKMPNRPIWFSNNIDFVIAVTPSHWDINEDMVKSPLWPYAGKNKNIFKCPADLSMVVVGGKSLPRVRSNSMSQVFGWGTWLNKTSAGPIPATQNVWRTYEKGAAIVNPSKTFVFVDEHPDSINDGAFAVACTGAEASDGPNYTSAQIIDYPANYHNGACGFSFADGHSEIHKWRGSKIRKAPVTYDGLLTLNVPAGDSGIDVRWMAENTTVRVK